MTFSARRAGLPGPHRLVPSLTTLGGLLKHLAVVERSWFQRRLAQREPAEIAGWVNGGDSSWTLGPDDTVEGLLAEYAEACTESRRVAARHAGHADILREQLDAARPPAWGHARTRSAPPRSIGPVRVRPPGGGSRGYAGAAR